MDNAQLYQMGQKITHYSRFGLLLVGLTVIVGTIAMFPIFIAPLASFGEEALVIVDYGFILIILVACILVACSLGLLLGGFIEARYAPEITDPIEAIKTLHMSAPKADIPWDGCEEESFEIVRALIQKGHSGMDIMFMGTRLEYYGLVAAHHEREEEMLRWAVTGSPEELAMTNDILKGYGYAIVKREESEG